VLIILHLREHERLMVSQHLNVEPAAFKWLGSSEWNVEVTPERQMSEFLEAVHQADSPWRTRETADFHQSISLTGEWGFHRRSVATVF